MPTQLILLGSWGTWSASITACATRLILGVRNIDGIEFRTGAAAGSTTFLRELSRLMEFAKAEYKLRSDLITGKRIKAEAEADQKQVSAQVSLYTAGVLFVIFVGLILLIVLLKIERNLRAGVINRPPAIG